MTLVALMEGLAAANIRAVVVGGMAVRLHGVNRVTDDVDVCYDTSVMNERALVTLLRAWQARPAGLAAGTPFTVTREALGRTDTTQWRTMHGDLDLMRVVPHIGTYRDLIAHADTVTLSSGLTLPLVNIEALIYAKERTGRPRDLDAAHELRARRALALAREVGLADDLLGEPPPPPAVPKPPRVGPLPPEPPESQATAPSEPPDGTRGRTSAPQDPTA